MSSMFVSKVGNFCAWTATCLFLAAPVLAETTPDAPEDPLKTKFIIDDADPESRIPGAKEALSAPLQMGYWVMMVSERADAAKQQGNLPKAIQYYRALAKAVPDRAVAFAKACDAYETLGDHAHALEFCKGALTKGGVTIDDHANFIRLLLTKPGALSSTEVSEASSVLVHLKDEVSKIVPREPPADASPKAQAVQRAKAQAELHADKILVEQLQCQLGVRIGDIARLRTCSAALQTLAPRDSKTLAFAFALALLEQNFTQARVIVEHAEQLGVPAAGIELMQNKLQLELAQRPLWRRIVGEQPARAAVASVVAALLACIALLASRRKLRRDVTA